jgi:hypothetical protein
VALWREGLLAQAVLRGRTTGYVHHPQLARFRVGPDAAGLIASYLLAVHEEAAARDYRFDARKIGRARCRGRLAVTRGQLAFEWQHLTAKLRARDPKRLAALGGVVTPEPHPLFRRVRGDVAPWEKGVPENRHRRRSPRSSARATRRRWRARRHGSSSGSGRRSGSAT